MKGGIFYVVQPGIFQAQALVEIREIKIDRYRISHYKNGFTRKQLVFEYKILQLPIASKKHEIVAPSYIPQFNFFFFTL